MGLSRIGVVGILIRAKQIGKIASLAEELERLRQQGGFWLSEQIVQQALESVGERRGTE